jgi:hypothetical protein
MTGASRFLKWRIECDASDYGREREGLMCSTDRYLSGAINETKLVALVPLCFMTGMAMAGGR